MNEDMCKFFEVVWTDFPDTLDDDGNYQFKSDDTYQTYCINETCNNDIDKINAWCLCLLNLIFGNFESFTGYAKSNMNNVQYILAWLSYILSRKPNEEISNLKKFYEKYIESGEGYETSIDDVSDYYSSYKNLIDKKNDFMNMDVNYISTFYEAFKILCSMYNDINSDPPDCTKNFTKTKEFVSKYQNLLNNNNINTKDSPYSQILSTLSTDYTNFKSYCAEKCNGCDNIPPLSYIEANPFVQNSEDTSSSSSAASKLIPVISIFVAIPILLGVAYKYSLFGFDKRLHRQYLREKVKKIKKKMNNYI
ncbi:CIR protein [Plasmodium chabaudi chabaudi]|uniref:CIR protein n=2 Tax=Plasmodium chabaudi chabaudi TaxID=31271 RepID=A0A077TJ61_PLACU|nr:CIR protein [Plasmodium chabaudi chabaudi]SCL81705.1 CIR protein [Plasmodium chabaudi chabaudi]VTZ67120.1 CIR protein [Plasmodium chabaudi chabaudi]|eukprot:XP_016652856.1 CIR protein [Plasmodium chabaudi chabaudi]